MPGFGRRVRRACTHVGGLGRQDFTRGWVGVVHASPTSEVAADPQRETDACGHDAQTSPDEDAGWRRAETRVGEQAKRDAGHDATHQHAAKAEEVANARTRLRVIVSHRSAGGVGRHRAAVLGVNSVGNPWRARG